MISAKVEILKRLVTAAAGKTVGVDFTKKDGSVRTMSFRMGVAKYVKGTKPEATAKRTATLKANGMIGVYEMRGTESRYRTVNLETVRRLAVNNVEVYTD